MFLDEFNENNTIKVVDETKYKSVFDLQLECINAEYELDLVLTEITLNEAKYDLAIVNESVSDKLKKVGEYLKKLWERFKSYIKKIYDWISKNFNKIKDKYKDYKNKDIIIVKPFTLEIIKIPVIKYVDTKELENMFDIIGFNIIDEKSIQTFIDKCKTLNMTDAVEKIQEKLSSAVGLPLTAFASKSKKPGEYYPSNEIKISNIEDFKKTKYYNYIKTGSMKIDFEEILDRVNDNAFKYYKGDIIIPSSNKDLIDNPSPEFAEAYNTLATLEKHICDEYRAYNNIIFYLLCREAKNYNIISANTNYSDDLVKKVNKSNDEFNTRNNKRYEKYDDMYK